MPIIDNFLIDRFTPAPNPIIGKGPRLRRIPQVGDTILRRASLLLPCDRTLVELAMRNGASRRALGRVLDIPAGTVTRRLRRVITRLQHPIVTALCESTVSLPREYRQLAIEHFLQGQSPRQLADLHRMRVQDVRRILAHVQGWHRGLTIRRADH